jgi:hypothetical protein
MRRLFDALRNIVDRSTERREEAESRANDALEVFENRMEVLTSHAERAMTYEEALTTHLERVERDLDLLKDHMEASIDNGRDRDALEFLRLAARLRPQRELLAYELNAFHAVADALIMRVNLLVAHMEEAREFARNARLSPSATSYLDGAMTKLTRYFVMLERVALVRRETLDTRLTAKLTDVIDDRKLDLEMATYILQRRRALNAGNG